MRGSSLADRDVLEALQPFLVATWSGKPGGEEAEEIRGLWESSGIVYGRKQRTNIFCFILDAQGKLVHSFGGFPNNAINPNSSGPGEDARYFRDEIAKAAAKIAIPKVESGGLLRLPDVASGVRLFIRTRGPSGDQPIIVEAVADETWKELAYPESGIDVDVSALFPWLKRVYPPGFNEQMYGWKKIAGTARLEPAGENRAVLRAEARLTTRSIYGRKEEIAMEAKVEAVLTFTDGKAASLRGVVEGRYPRNDEHRGRVSFDVRATVESRP